MALSRLAAAALCRCLLVAAALSGTTTAAPLDYPSRPVRLVVPFAPGGGNDAVARTLAQSLTASWGQPVIVDNKPGAGGLLGGEFVAKALPDGYTVFLGGVGSLAVSPQLKSKPPYDPLTDFAPVLLLASAPMVLVAHPAAPYATLPEMTAYAKAHPGTINYASNGTGSSAHIAALLYESMAQVQMTHVPYKGLGPAMNDLLSGQVPVMFSSLVAIVQHIQAGKLRALAVTGSQRSPLLQQVPTVTEAGLAGYTTGSWYGLLLPKGTPPEIVKQLHAASLRQLARPQVRQSFAQDGADIAGGTPEEFARFLRAEHQRIGQMLRDGRLRVEL